MFFVFWINPVRDSEQSVGIPWPVQLVYHGVMLLLLVAGFWLLAFDLPLGGWQKVTWQVGTGLTVMGLFSYLGLFACGLIIVGSIEVISGWSRIAGAASVVGSLGWLAVWLRGARFDSEGSLPLDTLERFLSTAGLVLICVGILALGLDRFRVRHHERTPLPL